MGIEHNHHSKRLCNAHKYLDGFADANGDIHTDADEYDDADEYGYADKYAVSISYADIYADGIAYSDVYCDSDRFVYAGNLCQHGGDHDPGDWNRNKYRRAVKSISLDYQCCRSIWQRL